MSTINNTTSIPGDDGASDQDSNQGMSSNSNVMPGANASVNATALQQLQLQELQQQLSTFNASPAQPSILTPSSASSVPQPGIVDENNNNSDITTAAPSAIPSAEGDFPTSLPASFLAALVQASGSGQPQQADTSAVPQQTHNALQALVQAQAQAQAQVELLSPGSLSDTAALQQQPTETKTQPPSAAPSSTISPNVSILGVPSPNLAAPSTNDIDQAMEPAPTTPVSQALFQSQTQSPPPPSLQQQQPAPPPLSASALFLQQQLAAQREAQALKSQHLDALSQQQPPSSQLQQQPKPLTTQVPAPHISQPNDPVISTLVTAPSPTGAVNVGNQTNQLQHDLQQLQLHNQRQAAAAAAAVAAEGGDLVGTGAPTDDSNINNAINQLLGADNNNGSSSDLGGSTDVQMTQAPEVPATSQQPPGPTTFSVDSPNINNGSGPIIVAYPGVGASSEGQGTPRLGTPAESDTTTSVNNDSAAETPQIFKATYSGVPVFEMICRGVAVMRRRSDSYLNATQILKVAEFDKPQRTRILEREVQKGEHEKVQGGYGKYQGTWVPYERGVQLCQEYNVLQVLRPLLEYQSSKVNSPPLAPKHVTAASSKPRKPREPRISGTSKSKKSKKGSSQANPKPGMHGPVMGVIDGSNVGDSSMNIFADGDGDVSTSELDDDETHSRAGSEASMDETMSILSAQSRTPSPIGSRLDLSSSEISDGETFTPGRRRPRSMERSPRSRKKQHNRPGDELFIGYHGGQGRQSSSSSSQHQQPGYHSPRIQQDIEMRSRDAPHSPSMRQTSPRRRRGQGEARNTSSWQEERSSNPGVPTISANQGHYAETLLEYFISDSTTLPSILTHPPADLDFDLIIDEEGHTPLHWAVAMARTKIVKLLVQHGADIYRVNNQGQTALMR
ncbi:hypothetical protein BGZ80_002369, partial [Entomortierella chlamydospora]